MAKKRKQNQISGYDLTFITGIDLPESKFKAIQKKIEGVIQSFDGEVISWEDLGRKKFAYPIEKEVRGQYTGIVFTAKGDCVAEIERNLRINENVIRFLTIRLSDDYSKEEHEKRLKEKEAAFAKEEQTQESRGSSSEKEDKKLMASRFVKRKECRLSKYDFKGQELDYKDVKLLSSFISEHGKIVPRRINGNTAGCQRKLTIAVKRARQMALMSPTTGPGGPSF